MHMVHVHGHGHMIEWEYGLGSTRMLIHTHNCKRAGRHGSKLVIEMDLHGYL